MKNSLGKLYILLLYLITLQAEDFTYKFSIDNTHPYVKEAVVLSVELSQTNHDIVLLFNFDIAPSKDYSFQRLDAQETDSYHNAKVHYIYLLYPLRPGEIDIKFNLLKKVTSDESIAYSFSGDRDNIKGLVTVDTQVTLPPLKLKVKALPKEAVLIGDFNLTYSIKQHQSKPHEPLPIQVTLKGWGYPPLLENILPKEGNFTRFTEQPIVQSKASRKGTTSTVNYPMALSHNQSFTLSTVHIKAFNPKTQKPYTLTLPSQHFNITKTDTLRLVDSVDTPQVFSTDWQWLQSLLSYLLVFAAGYFTAVIWKWEKSISAKEQHPLKKKIQNAHDAKALLQLLIATQNTQFASPIKKLESSLYGEGTINLNRLKQEILEKIV